MAIIYSHRLIGWSSEESPPSFEVPTGYIAVVRDLDVVSGGGSIINWQLSVDGVAKFAAGQFTVESLPQLQSWRGRQVVNAGEFVTFASDGAVDGMVSGYLLEDLS